MKKDNTIIDHDIRKIKEDWFLGELRYRFGACVSVSSLDKYMIIVFENGTNNETSITNTNRRSFAYSRPENENNIRERFREIMAQRQTLELQAINTIFEGYLI
jgi:hypothetical protein